MLLAAGVIHFDWDFLGLSLLPFFNSAIRSLILFALLLRLLSISLIFMIFFCLDIQVPFIKVIDD